MRVWEGSLDPQCSFLAPVSPWFPEGGWPGVAAQYRTDRLSLAGPSPAEDLFPGRRYDGGLDSGFHSVDSGSKRWSGNEVSASLPRDIGDLRALCLLPLSLRVTGGGWSCLIPSFAHASWGRAGLAADPKALSPGVPSCLPSLHLCIYSQLMTSRSCRSGYRSWPGSLGGLGSGRRMAAVSGGVRD